MTVDVSACLHCGKCQSECAFLGKYGLDFTDLEELKELAYHCFLCGKCSEVCPQGIDGRQVMLNLRRERVREAKGELTEPGYAGLLEEKADYKFKNYSHISKGNKRVLFPGCNFPSYFPETTKKLCDLLKKQGVETVFDCCGKPIAELGMEKEEQQIIDRINSRLEEAGVEEVIAVCPNCYDFLKPRLKQKLISIYEVLEEYGIGRKPDNDKEIRFFIPCPDRKSRQWLKWLQEFSGKEYQTIEEVPCCGLGGCAASKEPEISKANGETLQKLGYENFYTYCASCSGKFGRGNIETVHILTEILDTKEKADVKNAMQNRAETKFY